jgi:ABC-type amino acid transport substrate-binding protein
MGSEDLVAAINSVLSELIADGTIEGIFTAYGETYMKP